MGEAGRRQLSGGWRILAAVGAAGVIALIVAFLIGVEANNSQQIYEHQAAYAAAQYRDTARIHAERACARVAVPGRFECVHEQYHSAWQREREQYDLQAQLVTSAWTRAMGLAAIVAMFFGIVGVGLVYATFDATKEANRITRAMNEPILGLEVMVDVESQHGAKPRVVNVTANVLGANVVADLDMACEAASEGVFERVKLKRNDGMGIQQAAQYVMGTTYQFALPEIDYEALHMANFKAWITVSYVTPLNERRVKREIHEGLVVRSSDIHFVGRLTRTAIDF